jgi:hypothetical protein
VEVEVEWYMPESDGVGGAKEEGSGLVVAVGLPSTE